MEKRSLFKIAAILASLLIISCAAGCLEVYYGQMSSEKEGSSSMIDIFSSNDSTSSKASGSSSTKAEVCSRAQTSSENINFYNSGVLGPDDTSSEREIILYNSGVIVESENDSGRVAYDTPSGKKYHLSKECAGKNATEVSYDEIIKRKDPCKNCAKEDL